MRFNMETALYSSSANLTGKKAFILDDSAATRKIIAALLKQVGVISSSTDGGSYALKHLEESIAEYDVIFSDITMPGMDGLEFIYSIQRAPWYDGTPIIMVSTNSDATLVIQALKLGADDYIPKPFDKSILALTLERVLVNDQYSAS